MLRKYEMSSVIIRRDVGGGLLSSNNEPGVPHISDVRDASSQFLLIIKFKYCFL